MAYTIQRFIKTIIHQTLKIKNSFSEVGEYKMKFTVSTILIALLSFAIGLFADVFPWYSFVFCALIVAIVIPQKPFRAFVSGFTALFLLWIILTFIIDEKNQHILSVKVAHILPLGGSSVALIFITAFTGGLLAGLGALTGSYVRRK